uniref:Uncharacterized protein n=1 Tax=Tanacetum cinerariifolium TaxID=118510 RepID=A0A6L2N041_TANCI|nr:hypothetical protein [Tanacetum cinerariifolium]
MDSSKKRKTCVEIQNLSPKGHDINVGNEVEGRKSCHQCRHPSETDRVVGCNKCRSTKYCVTCINTWNNHLKGVVKVVFDVLDLSLASYHRC